MSLRPAYSIQLASSRPSTATYETPTPKYKNQTNPNVLYFPMRDELQVSPPPLNAEGMYNSFF